MSDRPPSFVPNVGAITAYAPAFGIETAIATLSAMPPVNAISAGRNRGHSSRYTTGAPFFVGVGVSAWPRRAVVTTVSRANSARMRGLNTWQFLRFRGGGNVAKHGATCYC